GSSVRPRCRSRSGGGGAAPRRSGRAGRAAVAEAPASSASGWELADGSPLGSVSVAFGGGHLQRGGQRARFGGCQVGEQRQVDLFLLVEVGAQKRLERLERAGEAAARRFGIASFIGDALEVLDAGADLFVLERHRVGGAAERAKQPLGGWIHRGLLDLGVGEHAAAQEREYVVEPLPQRRFVGRRGVLGQGAQVIEVRADLGVLGVNERSRVGPVILVLRPGCCAGRVVGRRRWW